MREPVWQHVAYRFATFLADLQPGAAACAAIDAARADVETLLQGWLRTQSASGYRITARRRLPSTEVVGGYASGTALAGCHTIDLLLTFAEDARPPIPARPKGTSFPYAVHRIIDLLGQRYGAVEVDRQGWISIRTDRQAHETPVRVRLLPAFDCASGGVLVAVPTRKAAGTPWRHLDAAAHVERLDCADLLSKGKARHLVRLVKSWRNAIDAPLSGFAIELLVCEFLSVWIYRRRSHLFYDWMVRDFFFWLAAQADGTLPVPGTLECLQIGDCWLAAAKRAHATARTAADLERENDSVAALGHWREIFGLGFCNRGPAANGTAAALRLEPPLRRKA